jgi:hypothetical protein
MVRGDTNHGGLMERFNVSNLALILILFLVFSVLPQTTVFSM